MVANVSLCLSIPLSASLDAAGGSARMLEIHENRWRSEELSPWTCPQESEVHLEMR